MAGDRASTLHFPKSQHFILGQRLPNHALDVLETLVIASHARENKNDLLRQANEGIEMTRWPHGTRPQAVRAEAIRIQRRATQ